MKRYKNIIVYGTFDLFHYGHLTLLHKSKEMCDNLIVGVASDEYAIKKGKHTIFNIKERCEIIKSIKYVDNCFVNDLPFESRLEQIIKYNADAIIVDENNRKYFNYLHDICDVLSFPRTPNISTSIIKAKIKRRNE